MRLAFQHADAPPPLRQRSRRGEFDVAGADRRPYRLFPSLSGASVPSPDRPRRSHPAARARRGPRVVAAGSPRSNLVGGMLPVQASHKMRPLQQSNATALRARDRGRRTAGAAIVSVSTRRSLPARSSLDITDGAAVSDAVRAARPDVIVNCAAFNDVDGAESALAALAVNAFAPRNLARARRGTPARRSFTSTDFVFDGKTTQPWDETAQPPRSRARRRSCSASGSRSMRLARTSCAWRASSAPSATGAAEPERWIPSSPDSRAAANASVHRPGRVAELCARYRRRHASPCSDGAPPGLYHCVNAGQATWYEVAQAAAELLRVAPS